MCLNLWQKVCSTDPHTAADVLSRENMDCADSTPYAATCCAVIALPAGTVHAISRGVLFLRDPKLQTQGGFFVVRNRQVRLRGSNATPGPAAAANGAPGAAAPGVGMGGAAAGMGMGVLASPQHAPGAGPQNPFGPGGDMGGRGGGGFGGGRGGGRGRGHGGGLMGQEVVVSGGCLCYALLRWCDRVV